MAWEYKGISIEPTSSGQFRAVHEGVNIIKPSLAAVKKDIDRRQSVKAEITPMNLPVVILLESSRYSNEGKTQIIHRAITGIDPESRRILGIEAPEGWLNSEILPESKENSRRLDKLAIARTDLKEADKSVKGREVELYIPSLSRNRPIPYGDAVKRLFENYAEAKKNKA
jgi:hypothetical protein